MITGLCDEASGHKQALGYKVQTSINFDTILNYRVEYNKLFASAHAYFLILAIKLF